MERNNADTQGSSYVSRFTRKLRSDGDYRAKYFTSVAICWSFVSLGWQAAQLGPSFLDLQYITHVSLEKGSAFITSYWVGYLSGSLISGYLIDRYNKLALIWATMLLNCIMFVIIPWCEIYELMVAMQLVRGLSGGGLDTCGTATLVFLWGGEGKSFLQVQNFAYAIGGILSPLATTPFLIEEADIKDYQSKFNSSTDRQDGFVNNVTLHASTSEPKSKLFIAYLITATMVLLSSLPILWLTVKSFRKKCNVKSHEKTSEQTLRKLPFKVKIVFLVTLACFFVFNGATEDTVANFLAAFCVKYMKWTKANASYVTVVYWSTFAIARFLGIFIVQIFKLSSLLIAFMTCICVGCVGYVLSGIFLFDTGIWICSVVVGFGMSIIFPTVISWTEENLFPVTGKISSLILLSCSTGAMINPIVLGFLMHLYTQRWFTYLIAGESVVMICIFVLMLASSKVVEKHMENKSLEVEIYVIGKHSTNT